MNLKKIELPVPTSCCLLLKKKKCVKISERKDKLTKRAVLKERKKLSASENDQYTSYVYTQGKALLLLLFSSYFFYYSFHSFLQKKSINLSHITH